MRKSTCDNRSFLSRKLSLGLVVISFTLLMAQGTVLSQTAVTPPGAGTQTSPYLISTIDHLVWMSETVSDSSGKYYTMIADIDAAVTATWNKAGTDTSILEGFAPIGTCTGSDTTFFRGTFDGGGHKITGLVIDDSSEWTIGVGLFGYVGSGGTVRNIGLVDGEVKGTYLVGGLVGFNEGALTNVCSSATVIGNMAVGGLVGHNRGTVSNTCATGSVKGDDTAGGLIGRNDGGTVTTSYAAGAVTCNSNAGGLVGILAGGRVTLSYWDIQTSGQSASCGGTGKTTAQMRSRATFILWDFNHVWSIAQGSTYPYLSFSSLPSIADIANSSIPTGQPYTIQPMLAQGALPVTWSLVTAPEGMVVDPNTGAITWANPTVYGSPHTVTIRATNADSWDEETWTLTVGLAPVIVEIPDVSIPVGQELYTGPTPAITQGTMPVTWSLVTGPEGMTIDGSTGVVSWPNPTEVNSPHTVTIRVTNAFGQDDETWQLGISKPPIIADIPDATIQEGGVYTGPTPVVPSSAGTVTWTLVAGPEGMEIDASTGAVTWSNPVAETSPYTVTIRATNVAGSCDESWALNVVGEGVVYSTRFTNGIDNEMANGVAGTWSRSGRTSANGETFSGIFANGTQSLTLSGLPAHNAVTISFDLYVIHSWDGNGPGGGGRDCWGLAYTSSLQGTSKTLLYTNFANFMQGNTQGFGGADTTTGGYITTGSFSPRTGSAETNHLGYGNASSDWGDTTYRLTFTVRDASDTITFNFTSYQNQGWEDEGWGLDNMTVSAAVLPDPPVISDVPDSSVPADRAYTVQPTVAQGVLPVTWSLVAAPEGMVVDPNTGAITWANPTVEGSPHTVTIRATNVDGSDDETWRLTVGLAPVIAEIPDTSILSGQELYTGPTPALSQGTTPVTWSLVAGPEGMTINASTGVVSWPSATELHSPYTITIRATSIFGQDEETWQLAINELPIIGDIADATIEEGVVYTGPTPVLTRCNPPVIWSLSKGPDGMTIDPNTGVVSWPNPKGSTGSYAVTIVAIDSNGSDTESWWLTVPVGYTAIVKADVHQAPAGTPILLRGQTVKKDTNQPVANAQVTIRIHVQGTRRVIQAISNAAGDFLARFEPLPSEAGCYTVGADHPGVTTDKVDDEFTIYGMEAIPATKSHALLIGGQASDHVELRNLGDVAISGIHATMQGIPEGVNVNVNAPESLTPSGMGTVNYTLSSTGTIAVTGTVRVVLSSSEGATTTLVIPVEVKPPSADLSVNPTPVVSGMVRGEQTLVQIDLENTGGASSGPVTVRLPNVPWMSQVSPNPLPAIAPGLRGSVVLRLAPDEELNLGPYDGIIVVSESGHDYSVPFTFTAISENRGNLKVVAEDEFTYYGEGNPKLAGAVVNVLDPADGHVVAGGQTDATGTITFSDLTEAYYTLDVQAPGHTGYRNMILVPSGYEKKVTAFLPGQYVTYNWTVAPTTIEDEYTIALKTTFKTNVPAPVLTIEPSVIDLRQIGSEAQIDFKITNHGLIAADNSHMYFQSSERYEIMPLVQTLGKIPANAFVIVPVRIRDKTLAAGTAGSVKLTTVSQQAATASQGAQTGSGSIVATSASGGCGGEALGASGSYACGGTSHPVEAPVDFRSPCESGGGSGGSGGSSSSQDPSVGSPSYSESISCGGGGGGGGGSDGCPESSEMAKWNLSYGKTAVDNGNCLSYALNAPGPNRQPSKYEQMMNAEYGRLGRYPLLSEVKELMPEMVQDDGLTPEYNPGSPSGCLVALYLAPPKQPTSSWDQDLGDYHWVRLNRDGTWSQKLGINGPVKEGQFLEAGFDGVPKLGSTIDLTFAGAHKYEFAGYYSYRPNIQNTTPHAPMASVQNESQSSESAQWQGVRASVLFYLGRSDTYWDFTSDADIRHINELLRQTTVAPCAAPEFGTMIGGYRGIMLTPGQGVSDFPSGVNVCNGIVSVVDTTGMHYYRDCVGLEDFLKGRASDQSYGSFLESHPQDPSQGTQPIEDGVCAKVKIQIDQKAVITRNAFKARIELVDNRELPLTGIRVDLRIQDAAKNPASEKFGILAPRLTNLSGVDGSGTVNGNTTGQAEWTIIPSNDAAPSGPVTYYVSGTLTYTLGEDSVTVPLYPVPIDVLPNPRLKLKYFLERDVYSDDPFTEGVVEPAVPFSLGLILTNTGAGVANNVRITSLNPQIVGNEKGLLVDFRLIGTQVGAELASPSVTVNLGNVDPNRSTVARWLMTASLEGKFTDIDATFEHVNGLGRKELSLLDSVEIHETTHVVRLDPNDDGRPDFLVNDTADPEALPDAVHSSTGEVFPVTAVTEAQVLNTADTLTSGLSILGLTMLEAGAGETIVTVTATMPSGWGYLRFNDPSPGTNYQLIRVVRSDGKTLRMGDNVWTTHRIVRLQGQTPYAEDFLHLLDCDSSGSYQLVYALTTPLAPSLGEITATGVTLLSVGEAFPATALHAVGELTTGKYVGLTGRLQTTPAWQLRDLWINRTIVGLTPATTYQFRTQARVADEETGFGPVTEVTTRRQGDLSGDGVVDFADYTLLMDHYGQRGRTWAEGDLNGDGRVNFTDYLILSQQFAN